MKYLIRDRDSKYPALFNMNVADADITVASCTSVRMPRMNAITELWVRTCRRQLLDRTLILNQRHLLHALRQYEIFYNEHRPRQGMADTRPPATVPASITGPDRLTRLDMRRHDRPGVLH